MSEEEPKIIIDEGWKAQVQREREAAAQKAAAAPEDAGEPEQSAAVSPEAPESGADAGADAGAADEEANFTALIGSLATQIMYTLGLVGDPDGGQVMVNLDAARYTLDVLSVLEEKTQGNLTAEEADMLTQTRNELEQVYVVRVQQFQEQAMQQSGIDPDNLKGA